jgi:hypothetical protein
MWVTGLTVTGLSGAAFAAGVRRVVVADKTKECDSMYEFLLVGGVVLWLAMAVVYARSGVATVYHPASFYMFFHGFIFVVRPILAWVNDYQLVYNLYSFVPTMEAKIRALLCADLGFLCFMMMVLRIGREPLVLRPTVGTADDFQRLYRLPLMVTTVLLAPLGIYSLQYVLRADSGEVAGRAFDAATGFTISTTGNGYLFSAGDIVGVLVILIAWQFRFRLLALVPFAMFVVARASGGTRWAFLLTSAAFALFWLYDRRRNWPSISIILGAIALLAAFTVVGAQRDIVKAYLTGGEVRQNLFQERLLEGMDYANMEYLEYQTWAIPDKTGTWLYFADNLQVLTEPIPRVLWPGKPIGAPIKMWDPWRYGTPIGMTSSLPGVGWDQLGYVGVAMWCGLWGWMFGLFYNWFARSRQTAFSVALYILLLPLSVQFFRDGGLLTALKFPMWFVFTLGVWKLISNILAGSPMASDKHRGQEIKTYRK